MLSLLIKAAGLGLVVLVSNAGFAGRIQLLAEQGRPFAIAVFVALWALSLAALAVAALWPRWIVRLAWGVPIALGTAASFAYQTVQGSELFVFDILNLWAARHEIDRAAAANTTAAIEAGALFAVTLALILLPPARGLWPFGRDTGWRRSIALLPALPVALIAAIIWMQSGKGSQGLPRQFAPVSMAMIAAQKLALGPAIARDPVRIDAGQPLSEAIVLMVDESIRADHVSFAPGNAVTPRLAGQANRFIDFGPAVSGGNCSHISNALLRFAVDRRDLFASARQSPTLWDYARAAGYRTVFIDGQSGHIRDAGKLQNYMTGVEAAAIDRFYTMPDGLPAHDLDDRVAAIALAELREGGRVFIYANKNGAHFPYVESVPPAARDGLRPSPGEDPRRPAYDAAIAWEVDRVMSDFAAAAPLGKAVMLYTSDHGQVIEPGRATHCSTGDSVSVEEGLVPLAVATDDPTLAAAFRDGAGRLAGHASHFEIAPTLLRLMGYRPQDVARRYAGSLFEAPTWAPAFVSGDIFGLFAATPEWHAGPAHALAAAGAPAGSSTR
jgi:glucan phosphoethanolaminetransferase (alkaline phosphatase superfamily)